MSSVISAEFDRCKMGSIYIVYDLWHANLGDFNMMVRK